MLGKILFIIGLVNMACAVFCADNGFFIPSVITSVIGLSLVALVMYANERTIE